MSSYVTVGISDMKIVKVPEVLISYALGSCVGICILDRDAKLAGMAHIMLSYNKNGDKENLFKYADTGITEMVRQMEIMGGLKSRMIAKIAGGAKMFEIQGSSLLGSIGDRNVAAVKETLEKLKIRIVSEDVGKNYGRTIIFDSSTGDLTIKSFGKDLLVI
ncbi:MAG TPA: chemotaxis protein CheD [Tissierellia bacterium]|jgi:chemotaxis protein CheD|nr:chemotaxis protein CheD [Tissierellia bacterium]